MERKIPHFDAVIGLGKNWSHKKLSRASRVYYPSLDTAFTAIACAELYQSGVAKKILFSTGQTLERGPSESEAMKLQLRSMFNEDEISDEDIILEEISIDTPGNAEEVKKIVSSHGMDELALVTVYRHAKRAKQLFQNYSVPITEVFISEDVLKERNFAVERNMSEQLLETGLTALLMIDPKGKLPRLVTNLIRK
jgi:uncharacterized SAM-binding protein YcdF (DUF218 family)